MNKFNNIFKEIKDKYKLKEQPIIWNYPKRYKYYKEQSYLKLYKALICEDYNIFPVPRLLMNDMLDFALYHNSLDEKTYTCKDILEKYILDWKYYHQFKENIKLMMEKNINCTITVVLFNNINDLIKIFEKYKNDEMKDQTLINFNITKKLSEGMAFNLDDGSDFDVCLAINISTKDKFSIAKIIQHELIHWMQITLNSETNKTYGKFKNQHLILNRFTKLQLQELGIDYEYLLDELEFEPWVANTIEEFSKSGLTINEYKNIIENEQLFINKINNTKNQGEYEMFIFGMVCYIVSNKKYENFWYYLIEAMKEN